MATQWSRIVSEVAKRVNAIAGAQSVEANTNYATNPIGAAQIDSPRFPYSFITDACVNSEAQIAAAVANVVNHPWRRILAGFTTALGSGDNIPLVSTTSLPIIGAYGAVLDESSGLPLTDAPIEVIVRRNRSTNLELPVYFYKIADRKIFHTRPYVTIDVCGYNRAQAVSNLSANNPISFPDVAVPAYIAGAVASLVADEEYMGQAQYYATLFGGALAELATGMTSVSVNLPPSPQTGSETV